MFALFFSLTQQMPFPDIVAKDDKGKKKTEQSSSLKWCAVICGENGMPVADQPVPVFFGERQTIWLECERVQLLKDWQRLFLIAQRQRSFLQSHPVSVHSRSQRTSAAPKLKHNSAVCTEFLQHQRNVQRDSWFSFQMFFILTLLVFYSSIKAVWTVICFSKQIVVVFCFVLFSRITCSGTGSELSL